MINLNERIGTYVDDAIYANNGDIVYGGPGNDQLFLHPFSHAYLIGGSGDDTYYLGVASYALILDTGGHDTIVAPFHISPGSTFAVTVDGGRHLVLGDRNSGTLLMVEDVQSHPIEAFNFNGFTTSLQGMEAAVLKNGMHAGDISYAQFEQWGLGNEAFWSTGMQAEIDYIVNREVQLFGSTPESNPGVSQAPGPSPQPAPHVDPVPAFTTSPLIDSGWYLTQNPDVAEAGADAITHYMHWGWREGRDPNSFFDTDWYLATYEDVAAAGVNPLEHYHHHGWREGRDPSANFDTSHYLGTHTDVALAGVNPLEHYINWGIGEGREIAAAA